MQYIKVSAPSQAEALNKLRSEYGSEAIVFHERKVEPKSMLGRMMGKKEWLIEAAIREKKPAMNPDLRNRLDSLESLIDKKNARSENIPVRFEQRVARSVSDPHENFDKEEFLKKLRNLRVEQPSSKEKQVEFEEGAERKEERGSLNQNQEFLKLQKDISFIKENLSTLAHRPESIHQQREFQELHDFLVSQDFTPGYAEDFVTQLRSTLPETEWKLKKRIYVKARDLLMSRIMVNSTLGSKRVVALVGPTGVGKTTTIAKLAARLKLKEKLSVSFFTLDNFRIAATEQLKVYGNIMDIPVTICKDPERFKAAIDADTADIILVDTTGMSQNNRDFLMTQHDFFQPIEHLVEKHLVLPATSKKADAEMVMQQFDILHIDRIILSKLDESSTFGAYLEISENWHKPFSFFTIGQKVPDDYIEADRKFLAEKVLEKWVSGISYDMT